MCVCVQVRARACVPIQRVESNPMLIVHVHIGAEDIKWLRSDILVLQARVHTRKLDAAQPAIQRFERVEELGELDHLSAAYTASAVSERKSEGHIAGGAL